MKLGILFSGGKDSSYALYKSNKKHEIVCLLSIASDNPDSYMFHTPNIRLTELQAKALELPLITRITKGEKEKELEDLRLLIKDAKEKYKIKGIVTGAVASNYQASRIKKICDGLNLDCLNPLWGMEQVKLLNELIKNKFEVIITKVAAYPFDESFLGKSIDNEIIKKLKDYQEKYKINPAGEGGEIETLVADMPIFKKRIKIIKSRKEYSDNQGVYIIEDAELADK